MSDRSVYRSTVTSVVCMTSSACIECPVYRSVPGLNHGLHGGRNVHWSKATRTCPRSHHLTERHSHWSYCQEPGERTISLSLHARWTGSVSQLHHTTSTVFRSDTNSQPLSVITVSGQPKRHASTQTLLKELSPVVRSAEYLTQRSSCHQIFHLI